MDEKQIELRLEQYESKRKDAWERNIPRIQRISELIRLTSPPSDWPTEMNKLENGLDKTRCNLRDSFIGMLDTLIDSALMNIDQIVKMSEDKISEADAKELQLYKKVLSDEMNRSRSRLNFTRSYLKSDLLATFDWVYKNAPLSFAKEANMDLLLKLVDDLLNQTPVVSNVKAIPESHIFQSLKRKCGSTEEEEKQEDASWLDKLLDKLLIWQSFINEAEKEHLLSRASVFLSRTKLLFGLEDHAKDILNGLLMKLMDYIPDPDYVEKVWEIKKITYCQEPS